MESILNKLILPDNNSISEGTNELREAFKKSDAIPSLCSVIGTTSNSQIRQLAAVILRKKLAKHRYWLKLPLETKQFVKQGLMGALVNDQEKTVKTAIGQVIGVLIRHEMPENGWPELLQFIQHTTTSQSIQEQELGFFTLKILTDMSVDHFLTHAHSFASLLSSTLNGIQDPASNLAFYTILCLTNFVPAIEGDQFMVNAYHEMVPKVLLIIKGLAVKRPDKAIEALCLIDELTDNAITVIIPHLKLIVETCLELSLDSECGIDLQIKALNIIGLIIQTKKKQVVKLKLIEPVLDTLFRLMCMAPEDEATEEYFPDVDESSTPTTVANQTLDLMALHLPPEKLLPPLMQKYVVPSLENPDVLVRRAAYLALAVVAEGCADHIRQYHMKTFVTYVVAGLKDSSNVVNNAAFFAVGQFSEHLQPNISVHASDLVPFLLQNLVDTPKDEQNTNRIERMFYALETFCENLNEGLLPYLPMLMQFLLPILSPPHPIYLRELAISAVGACAMAAKEEMMPYFQQIMESLKVYLTEVQEPETLCLQVQSVDTLGILARNIGNDNFLPMAQESIGLGIQLIAKTDDPDLRKSAYGLFSSVSSVLKQNMGQFLPAIMDSIIKSTTSENGVTHQKDENNPTIGLFENISDTEEEEDLGNSSDVSSDKDESETDLVVENAYLEEKEQAIIAIRELAQNCMEVFLPYVEGCFQEVFKLVNYPHDDIRSASISTLSQLCVNVNKVNSSEGNQALLKALDMLVPKCAEIIRTDKEREVVITSLDAYHELLKEVGRPVLQGEGHTDAIINCVKDVLNCRTECQDKDEEEDEEAEGDELLIESAGEIIPVLGKVMPPHEFAQHYTQFLPMFFNLTKKQASDSQRSFGAGMLAECMAAAAPCLQTYTNQLLPLLCSLAKDHNDEVRNNAIFALGELVYHGKECVFPYYKDVLQTLSSAVANESNSGALDNICGALARLIITNSSAIPLDQVIPVFVRYLPLREDFEENKWIFQSITHLYQMGCEPLVKNLNPIIKACAISLHENQIESEYQSLIINLLQCCHRDFPSECTKVAEELPESIASTLKRACVA